MKTNPIFLLLTVLKGNAFRLWASQNAGILQDTPIETTIQAVSKMAQHSGNEDEYLANLYLMLPFDNEGNAAEYMRLAQSPDANEQRLAAVMLASYVSGSQLAEMQIAISNVMETANKYSQNGADLDTNFLQYNPANYGQPSSTMPPPLVLQSSQNSASVASNTGTAKDGSQFKNIASASVQVLGALGGLLDKAATLKNGASPSASGANSRDFSAQPNTGDNNAIKWLIGIFGFVIALIAGIAIFKRMKKNK